MRSLEQYDEICKYFAEGKQTDANASEVQKQLKLYDLSIIDGKPNQLYAQRMRSFKQYDEICKHSAERKQRDANANEVKKQLKLYDLSVRELTS